MGRYKFLKESENWSLDELRSHQLQELKRIMKVAYDRSPFYKNLYDKAGINPSSIKSLSDITSVPIVTKKDLLDYNAYIQNKDGYRKLFYSETSGSTGESLVMYRDSNWDASTRAAQLRGYSWYGVQPWERNGYFWGFSFDPRMVAKTKLLDFMLNRFRLFSYTDAEIMKFQKKLRRASYLEGYSSMVYETAKRINANSTDSRRFRLKMVKGTSEKIYDHYQPEVEKAFGQKMVSEYGSCETGIIAFECPRGSMHISMENVIVEEVNGEAVITNLVSDSFPIIRYKIGDAIKLDLEKICECGMAHNIISEVMGRVGKLIYGENEDYPSLTLYYIFKNMAIKYGVELNYQAIQSHKGKLTINLEQDLSADENGKLLSECYNYFKDDIEITVNPASLTRSYEEKFKDFISHID